MIPSANGLCELLDKNKNLTAIEIGSQRGISSEYFLRSLPNLKLYAIDPYTEYVDWDKTQVNINWQNSVFHVFQKKVSPYYERIELYKMTSDDAVNKFEDGSVDFIFIDGLHSFEQVYKDCVNYYPKLKKGGLFSGHDYKIIEGVRDAINKFSKEVDKKINTTEPKYDSDVWYWIK